MKRNYFVSTVTSGCCIKVVSTAVIRKHGHVLHSVPQGLLPLEAGDGMLLRPSSPLSSIPGMCDRHG